MLRVYYSNRTEELVDALNERIRTQRGSLFDAIHVLVPNWNMETYLKLALARTTGVCANVRVRLLRDLSRTGVRHALLDRVLATLFDADRLSGPELGPLRAYLAAGGGEPRDVERRRVQLARKLTHLYHGYAESRPELLDCWRAGLLLDDPATKDIESWQRRLWLELAPPDDEEADLTWAPPVLHVFGVSYFTRSQLDVLGRLASVSELHVYALNPCQEIWEATSTPGPAPIPPPKRYERRAKDLGPGEVFSLDDPFRLENDGEMLLLRLWGRIGRENLRLLNALTGCELIPHIKGPEPSTLLEKLQRDIALRKPTRRSIPEEHDFEGDESVVIVEAPDVRRELDTIASEIWRVMSSDASLRLNDIAVILAPSRAARYQALLPSVFDEMHQLPHNIVDLPVRSESRLAEAVELLLEIPLGRFTRHDVLRFVTHPTIAASFPGASSDDWVRWCDALGIVHGIDRRDHDDTYIDKDVFNWDQGLKRLALGAFMDDERESGGRCFQQGDDAYLPERVDADQLESAASFGALLRSLLADAREVNRVTMTLPAWMDFVSAFIATYVEAHGLDDERVLRRCLAAVDRLAGMTLGGNKVGYTVAHELLRDELERLSGERGQYLVDGVVVSSFLPMRAIPFKVIFVAGLGDGLFPATDSRDHLDLRRAHRRAGDVSARERDRYLFLETLLSARKKLHLSYVARDELTGEPLQPSSLVLELVETLEQGYVRRVPKRMVPVRRDEDPATRWSSRAATRARNARALGDDLRSHLGASSPAALRTFLPIELPQAVRDALGYIAPPPRDEPARVSEHEPATRVSEHEPATRVSEHEPARVSLGAIRRFLECPLQGSARFILKLRDESSEALVSVEDELFDGVPLARAILLREAFLLGGDAAAYDRVAHRFESRGEQPAGLFGDAERERHLGVLGAWRESVRELLGTDAPDFDHRPPTSFLVGETRVDRGASPVLLVKSPRVAIRLVMQAPHRFHAARESIIGFLDHVFHAASGTVVGEPYTFVTINAPATRRPVTNRFVFSPISRDAASQYLATVISEMLNGVHDYLLPCEVVLNGLKPLPVHKTSSRYGPIKHPEEFSPLDDSLAQDVVKRRFGLYFESLDEGKTSP